MAKRDSFLLRLDPALLAAIRKWSDDELRSMNGQIEYLLRQSLVKAGRAGDLGEKRGVPPEVPKPDNRDTESG